MSGLRVYVYPADREGCGHYRLIWPAIALRDAGHDVVVRLPEDRHELRALVSKEDGRVRDAFVPADADVIVLQRVTHRNLVEAIPLIRRKYGCAVVIDLDDDLSRIDPGNAAFTAMHPRGGVSRREARAAARRGVVVGGSRTQHSWHGTAEAAAAATLVTVSTPALLRRYGSNDRGVVLRNRVPRSYLDVRHHDDPTIVGWAGSLHSHPDDMRVVGPALARLTRDLDVPLTVVGPRTGVRAALGLDREPDATGVVPLVGWPEAVTRLGVGVAPLADTNFNAAKSWLKMLEYAAVGVPCVGSPRAEYVELHRRGVGLLAADPGEWYRRCRELLTDESLRLELAEAGRAAAAQLTIEADAWRWAEAWAEAARRERNGRARFLLQDRVRGVQERTSAGRAAALRAVGQLARAPLPNVAVVRPTTTGRRTDTPHPG